MKSKTLLLLFLSTLIASIHTVSANILDVPDEYFFIQDAILIAEAGDTVLVQPGMYFENINFEGQPVIVASTLIMNGDQAMIDSTIIDGGQVAATVVFSNEENDSSALIGFTIRGGLQNFGGGIDCQSNTSPRLEDLLVTQNSAHQIGGGIYCTWNSTPAITRVRIIDNQAQDGAGIGLAHQCRPILTDVVIRNNTATNGGGGLFAGHGEGECELHNVEISNNTAMLGGAAYFDFTQNILFNDVQIVHNTASEAGGGIYSTGSDIKLVNCQIDNNIVRDGNGGGVMSNNYSKIEMFNCTVRSNTSTFGGGFYFEDEDSSFIDKCVIVANYATSIGGAAYIIDESVPWIVNCTLYSNVADSLAGGLYCITGCEPVILNSILWGDEEGEIYLHAENDSNVVVISHSNVQGGFDGIEVPDSSVVFWLESNIDADPMFVNAEFDSLMLTVESPCIDAGTALFVFNDDTLWSRAEGAYLGEAPDMGAFESEPVRIRDEAGAGAMEFELLSVWPNPFNNSATVRFHVSGARDVRLGLFDIHGRMVKSLFEGFSLPGWHEKNLNVSGLPAGTYIIRSEAGDKAAVSRLILVK